MIEASTTITFLALLAAIFIAIAAVPAIPKLLKSVAWLGIVIIGVAAAYAYVSHWRFGSIKLNPTASPSPAAKVREIQAAAMTLPQSASPIIHSPVPDASPRSVSTPRSSAAPVNPTPMETNSDLNIFRERKDIPAPSPSETLAKKTVRAQSPQNYDLGDVIATADWARLTQDRLEVSFRFTNKTQRPLWIIPATPRDKGGIQASDDVKNRYALRSTIGFSRGTVRLHRNIVNPNDFLELRPDVPAPASFIFRPNRDNAEGATEIYFFATLTIVDDLKTFRSDNRTVSATLRLD